MGLDEEDQIMDVLISISVVLHSVFYDLYSILTLRVISHL